MTTGACVVGFATALVDEFAPADALVDAPPALGKLVLGADVAVELDDALVDGLADGLLLASLLEPPHPLKANIPHRSKRGSFLADILSSSSVIAWYLNVFILARLSK